MAGARRRRVPAVNAGWLRSVAMIAVFDIGGPLLAYSLLRSAGFSSVTALVLSGVFPATGVIIGIIARRRVDALGVLVLAGIVVGAILGLVSHNPKLVLDEGSVGTGVFGLICLGSLTREKPLMYRLALEFIGPDTRRGREFADLWQYEQFRHTFRVVTVVWGTGYLAEAAARVAITASVPAGTALAISKVLPYVVAGVLAAWTAGYGRHKKRQGEALGAAAEAAAVAEAATEAADVAEATGRGAARDSRPVDKPSPESGPAERPPSERPEAKLQVRSG